MANMGWDSVVDTVTCYKLDSLDIVSGWGVIFFAPVQAGPRSHPTSFTMGTGSLSWGKVAGAWH